MLTTVSGRVASRSVHDRLCINRVEKIGEGTKGKKEGKLAVENYGGERRNESTRGC